MPLTLLLSLGLVLSVDPDDAGAVIVDQQDGPAGPADEAGGGDGSGGGAAGTRQQPLPAGTTGDWQVRLKVTIPDTIAQVAAENQSNVDGGVARRRGLGRGSHRADGGSDDSDEPRCRGR
ncbi:hypothetical protein [Pseudofrankia sp. BMG5.36]|uniref:hypothetical protein n=1 Tax=Pseudofrankia sp. BMG5.36 TaxID=1834512 RepID=UPI0008DB1387|nr:hypothetical protein [Pseudofrankia sp. BMG5.36]OHV63676.1 hypothetical protein BCD48_37900 [Pseudofrankia sp. BMG5.36]